MESQKTPADEAGAAIDETWMDQAIAEAWRCAETADVPVGAVILRPSPGDGSGQRREDEPGPDSPEVVGRGRNRREADQDPTAHAEILALRAAAARLGTWNLDGCTLYVTQEPCPMCAGAIVNARIERVVYGCASPKAGAARSLFRLLDDPRLNHRARVTPGVRAVECGRLLSEFFARLRMT